MPFYLYDEQCILPIFLKDHSYGEFIFDWAWAQAYQRVGLPYYPKFVAALPHTPASAPKFISKDNINYKDFLNTIDELLKKHHCSSSHFLFTQEKEQKELIKYGYLERHSLQYFWQNSEYKSFHDFLGSLRKEKRKNFKREREAIALSGIIITEKTGDQITVNDARFMAKLYLTTIEKKISNAYLNEDFFIYWFESLKDQMLYVQACKDDEPIAAAIHVYSDSTLFGRYWGSLVDIPFLHFELCYYRAIDFAIKNSFKYVEGGAQGEHKLLRGFRPTKIYSAHKIEHNGFKDAVTQYLKQESQQINALITDLNQLLPFKRT